MNARRLRRLLLVLAGIVVGQAVLYGPSLTGVRILLPLDILTMPRVYLPPAPGVTPALPHDRVLADLVLYSEPGRLYQHRELAAGRFPFWNPYQYGGVPNSLAKFSPFLMLGALFESPKVLAWIELLGACIAGVGMYFFCRRALLLGSWPATLAAWCYPLTGFLVLWLGYGTRYPVVWLPWLLWAIHRTLQGVGRVPGAVASAWIAVLTALILVSGRLDIAGQVLLVSGLYAVGCMFLLYRDRRFGRGAVVSALLVLAGWGLGFMLAAPDTLPMVEYVETGARPARRGAGEEERPPIGLPAVPQVVLPFMYGSTQAGSVPNFPKGEGNILESPAAAYTGILATLFLAPLAFCSRRHRGIGVVFVLLTFFCLSWCFKVPGLVSILRLPGLNLMSHNRLTFGATFSILALAAIGFEAIRQCEVSRRWWFWVPAATLAAVSIWGIGHAATWDTPAVTRLQTLLSQGQIPRGVTGPEQVPEIQAWFTRRYLVSGVLAGLGAAGWLLLWFRKKTPAWTAPLVGLLLGADLLWFGHGQPAQSPASLYYPSIPVLDEVARAPAGRMIGYACLPASLAQTHGLREIRGYDSVDPARLMDLMRLAADPRSPWIPYALIQSFIPRLETYPPDIVKLPPILNMLNVEYVVFYGDAPKSLTPVMQGNGYWALVNHDALPRAFVPERVETVLEDSLRLKKLGAAEFDPRKVAYVESSVSLPAECRGEAGIVEETSTRITLSAKMATPGLVVLADLWDKGWKVFVNGRVGTIERANHAVRGVVVPAGESTLEFRYRPAGFTRGLWISGFALLTLVSWVGYGVGRSGKGEPQAVGEPEPLPAQARATRSRRDKRATGPGKNDARGPSSPSTPPRRPGG